MKLSIIIPVYNEEKTVAEVLRRIGEVELQNSLQKEIIIVSDGSTDHTNKILSRYKGIKFYKHSKNLGKGAALQTGFRNSTGDFLVIQDADLEYHPRDYARLLKPLIRNEADVVYGSRLMNYPLRLWGRRKTVLPLHLLANKFLTLFTNLFYHSNLTDMETGYKVFRKSVIDQLKIKSNKFDFEAEVTAKILKRKIPIVEVPIIVRPRTYKEGKKIGWKDGFSAIWTLIKYRFI
ncbi:glycosyltransferase family 2 protein [Candidatus Daviesbacteria bacterium]|nr:glycosyltransferase family 2 protein [Candidatus Daviesbacteria bacterium]